MNKGENKLDSQNIRKIVQQGLAKRKARENLFRRVGLTAIVAGMLTVLMLFGSIIYNGHTAFVQSKIRLDIDLLASEIDPTGEGVAEVIAQADYSGMIKHALRVAFPEVGKRKEKRALYGLVSSGGAYELQKKVLQNPSLIGTKQSLWLTADGDVDMFLKHAGKNATSDPLGRLQENQITWLHALSEQGRVEKQFNTTFFTAGDSREPELSGIRGALMGTIYTLIITLLLSFPIGVSAAIYLEEFAPQNRWTDFIEVNINNLAAVPSIVFGLLGLAVFINFFGLPRSTAIVGGLVLTLMTLPTIIIASRAALKSVPPSIRQAALGIGASQMQAVFHHVVPLAMPGMLTGSIIGMAQALGETAPLLMIGMVAFIVDIPGGFQDPSTVLPVQIFLWADSPERGFLERTSAAIMVLLAFLILMNLAAILLRRKFEQRW